MDESARYAVLRARDRRFDGRFFVGVRTTGIYCRPVCRARLPQRLNCSFFETAAEAEESGFRPCLRCRPELAPGRSLTDASSRLAAAAYARITGGALQGASVREVARELHVSERQLRRAVRAQFGVSPVALAQTQRLLVAKQLLTETDLPVSRIAFAAGFSSLSFNTLFSSRYRLSPTALRRNGRTRAVPGDRITLLFSYRPPLAWDRLLAFFAARAIPGVERVTTSSYARTVRFGDHTGWFSVRHAERDAAALEVEIAESLVPALLPLRAAVRSSFDLDAEPDLIAAHFAHDPIMGPLVRAQPGLRLPGTADVFELAVRGVLGQQVSVAAARTLAGRLHAEFGDAIEGVAGLSRLPVTAERIATLTPEVLSRIGMPLSRARTLIALAEQIASGALRLTPTSDVAATVDALKRIRGIGAWTAEYIALRGLHWPDAFPATDLGVRNALGAVDARDVAERWRPWRGYAVIHLWTSLERNRSR